MRRLLPALLLLALPACPSPSEPDAGGPVDSGSNLGPACDSPEDCKVAAFDGVCRQGVCTAHVPCANDLECGLGEACTNRECAFTGCATDGDCSTGRCRIATFSCAECGENADCPFNRPICQASTQKCVECEGDSQCPSPGPSHCEAISGSCQHCLKDEHCPNGLQCAGGTCFGVPTGGTCPNGTACAEGLTCVNLGGVETCLQACNAYSPSCPSGQICYTLKYADSISYVFDMGGLLGVCFNPVGGARNYRDSCTVNAAGLSNCQPSLACIPDSAQTSSCRAYCDPGQNASCPSPELCHPFSGDFNGRQYGLCYGDNGWGTRCTKDAACRAGQSCQPYDDPAQFDELSPACLFNVGTAPGLAPCAGLRSADGGAVAPDSACASGACRGDSFPATNPYFCYAACATDDDCSIGTRKGTCDGDYAFDSKSGFTAYITGCRPGCDSTATCAQYSGLDAGLVCRPRLASNATSSGLKLNCGKPNVGLSAGSACSFSGQCQSGYCAFDDARGVRRNGYCLEPCQNALECAAAFDGGLATGTLDCLPTTFLGYRGPDGLSGTRDDALDVKRVCSGLGCKKDEDCTGDAGARCVPDVDPADAGGYVLRCRPPTTGVKTAGTPCALDVECGSGACGTLGDSSKVCFQSCDPLGPSPCPGALTCRAAAFHFTATLGGMVTLDGCAP